LGLANCDVITDDYKPSIFGLVWMESSILLFRKAKVENIPSVIPMGRDLGGQRECSPNSSLDNDDRPSNAFSSQKQDAK
jgi:hypothetical protein